ncbi:hypothetical protein GCM10022243_00620 [Saccharothrix violaceirubra]
MCRPIRWARLNGLRATTTLPHVWKYVVATTGAAFLGATPASADDHQSTEGGIRITVSSRSSAQR